MTMTREEKKRELTNLFLSNMMGLGQIIDAAYNIAESIPNWISVYDELPKENERIIAYNGVFNEIHLCDFHDGIFEDFYGPFDGTITHWMPLPEAPRKEADND